MVQAPVECVKEMRCVAANTELVRGKRWQQSKSEYRLLDFLHNMIEIGLTDAADFVQHVTLDIAHQELALDVALLGHRLGV